MIDEDLEGYDEDVAAATVRRLRPVMPEVLREPGTFTLKEVNPPNRQKARTFKALMTTAPIPTTGYGGWSRVARPRRKALTEWVGRDSVSVTIQFLLDNYADGRGLWIENKCQILDELAGVESHDPEPPLMELHSDPPKLMPHGHARASHNLWFIDGLSWNADDIRYNKAGNRIRASGTLILTQFVKDVRLSPAAKKRTTHGGRRRTYRVRAGDTLMSIAARKDVYGNWRQWRKIARANKIRDPKKLKIGQVLRIP